MEFPSSSSPSSSSSHYTSSALPASTSNPRWGDFPIYESTPHFPPPPMENGRLAAAASNFYPNYGYNYSNYNYSGGGSTAGRAEEEAAGVKEEEEREHMFDKVVTPSDVGKLNRLVIPKQHAEKYFPLDSNSSDKGLLLDFEDRSGKSWRFRYSYWNSSQSYVMTKGWSRFVKEKKLDAGDIVSFQRGLGDIGKDRFYIDWRRRPAAPPPPHPHHHQTIQFHHRPPPLMMGPRPPPPPLPPPPLVLHHHQQRGVISYNGLSGFATSASGYNFNYNYNYNYNYGDHYNYSVPNPNFYGAASFPPPQMRMQMTELGGMSSTSTSRDPAGGVVFESIPVGEGSPKSVAAKRLRLFGVNMDCTVTEPNAAAWSASSPSSLPMNVLHSSSPEAPSLQLRLHGDGSAASAADSAAASSLQAIEFLDKGKSSMTLDFHI